MGSPGTFYYCSEFCFDKCVNLQIFQVFSSPKKKFSSAPYSYLIYRNSLLFLIVLTYLCSPIHQESLGDRFLIIFLIKKSPFAIT